MCVPFLEHLLLVLLHLLQHSLLWATLLLGLRQVGGHPLLHVLQPPAQLLQPTLKPGGMKNTPRLKMRDLNNDKPVVIIWLHSGLVYLTN